MLQFSQITSIPGAYYIKKKQHKDERGFFERAFCSDVLKKHGLVHQFVQTNISGNNLKGTLRGLHFQNEPYSETKLVACVNGAVFDVLVDIRDRRNIKWEGFHLTEGDGVALYIPKGVAHGYITMTDNSTIIYFVDQEYKPSADNGIRWDDPSVGIKWPIQPLVISDKDKGFPLL